MTSRIECIQGKLYVGHEWTQLGGDSFESLDPVEQYAIWRGPTATGQQVDAAFLAARSSFRTWGRTRLEDRIEIARRFASVVQAKKESLAQLISTETGKPLWESRTEVATVIGKVEVSIDALQNRRGTLEETIDGQRAVTRFRPHGVLLVLGPFNLPAHLPGSHMVPALLAGNCVVFKPSEQTPAVGEWLVEAWYEAGLPKGVIQLLHGGVAVAQQSLKSNGLDGVLFTGSYRAGRSIHQTLAGSPEKVVALEMGGNNPLIVGKVNDLGAAVYQIVQSAYITSGQRCTCARRLYIENNQRGDQLIDLLLSALQQIHVDRPFAQQQPFMSSLIHRQAAEQMLVAQEKLIEQGATVLRRMQSLPSSATILTPGLLDVTTLSLADEEHFGPLLVLQRTSSLSEAIERANQTSYGLAAGLLSDDAHQYEEFSTTIRAGIVNWNRQTTGASGRLPFGGIGRSGNHRPSGFYAADYCSYPVASLESSELNLPATASPGLEEFRLRCSQK